MDDGTRQVLEITYNDAMAKNGCANLLELQQAKKVMSWKIASKNEFTFACFLTHKLVIQVFWDAFNKNTIASAPNSTLRALPIQFNLPLTIQIGNEFKKGCCTTTESQEYIGLIIEGVTQMAILTSRRTSY